MLSFTASAVVTAQCPCLLNLVVASFLTSMKVVLRPSDCRTSIYQFPLEYWLMRLSGYASCYLHGPLSAYTSRRLVTQAVVCLHKPPSAHTGRRLVTHSPSGCTSLCVLTQAVVWFHKPFGYTSSRWVARAAVSLHRPSGDTSCVITQVLFLIQPLPENTL